MIKRYNQTQIIKTILHTVTGVFFCWLAYLFFSQAPAVLSRMVRYHAPEGLWTLTGLVGLGVTWISGYCKWRANGGLASYHESGLYHDLGEDTTGAVVTDFYLHRITGPAYVLSQMFIAGPLFLLRALTLWRSRLAFSEPLEHRLAQTLEALQSSTKWEQLSNHQTAAVEILMLAQMDKIDFSAHKGIPRFKSRQPDGL